MLRLDAVNDLDTYDCVWAKMASPGASLTMFGVRKGMIPLRILTLLSKRMYYGLLHTRHKYIVITPHQIQDQMHKLDCTLFS